jgi:hypothetical protein
MNTGGHKTALEEAVAAARTDELARETAQPDLFREITGAPPNGADFATANGFVGDGPALPVPPDGTNAAGSVSALRRGRPAGARNKRTDEAARFYMARHGDPLERGVAISSLPLLAKGVLEGLAERLGCTRHEAAKFWSNVYAATLPFVHQRLATLTLKNPGAPGGEPLQFTYADDGALIVDLDGADGPEPGDYGGAGEHGEGDGR